MDRKEKIPSIKKAVPKTPQALDYDRDKNVSYVPNDEAVDEITTESGNKEVVHLNREPIEKKDK